jgi:imidazolonepropionase-like amidohydrolase
MKILKKALKFIGWLLVIIILFTVIVFIIDSYKTSYLKTKNIENSNNSSYLITNVNVITMTQDSVLPNKMVYIKEGKIHKIGNALSIKNVPIINANGKFLTPGLIDMHVHVWDKYELGLYVSYGVTSVRNLWGRKMHLRLKEQINNGDIIAPNFYTSSPKLTGPEFIGDDNVNLTSPKEATEKIISYKAQGYDFIKTYYGLTEDIFDAIVKQASLSKIDLIAHPTPKVAYSYHFKPEIKTIEHTEDIIQQPLNYKLDSIKLKEIIDLYVKNPNTKHSPTLIVYKNIYNMMKDENILSSNMVKHINPLIQMVDSKAQFDRWNNAKKNDSTLINRIKSQHEFHLNIIQKLHKNGVDFVCSTDAGIGVTVPGYSLHQELSLYKEAGLSNYEVLKTATINASKVHKEFNSQGTIEIGKDANLLLVDKNPLQDLSSLKNPNSVFINGKLLNRNVLDTFKEKSSDRSNLIVSAFRYLEYLLFER